VILEPVPGYAKWRGACGSCQLYARLVDKRDSADYPSSANSRGGVVAKTGIVPSGYAETDDYIGVAHHQHHLRLATVQLPWPSLIKMVRLPDPGRQTDYNRPLRPGHAQKFMQYLDVVDQAYTPPIALFTDPANLELEEIKDLPQSIGNVRFVMAKFIRSARDQVHVLDGQHRIFGAHLLEAKYQEDLASAREQYRRAEKFEGTELIEEARGRVKTVQDKIARFGAMTVSVQIALTGDRGVAKQIFADVADNALGISRSILSEFSTRSAFNRAAQELAQKDLAGVVDNVKDRMSRSNPHWLSLKDVVNVVQVLELPLTKRWSHKLEEKLDEGKIYKQGAVYFAGLAEAFPEVRLVLDGEVSGPDLRLGGEKLSLLGSTTMVRVLASAYRVLREGDDQNHPLQHDEIVDFFASLPMQAGFTGETREEAQPLLDTRWLETGKFSYPYVAPVARTQDIEELTGVIVGWARS
jgi:hypothetical protein